MFLIKANSLIQQEKEYSNELGTEKHPGINFPKFIYTKIIFSLDKTANICFDICVVKFVFWRAEAEVSRRVWSYNGDRMSNQFSPL